VGTTEDQLRWQADAERARMGETLEAIGDRLSPERMMERRKAAVMIRMRRIRESVMGSPDYDEPATQNVRERASGMASAAGDTARSAADRIQHAPDALAEQTRGNPLAAGLIAFGAGMLVATAFPRTRAEQRVVDSAAPGLETAKQELREGGRQLAAGAKEHAQEAAQHVSDTATQATHEVADHAKTSAEKVKDQASSGESSS
jgi:hypothetical protein